MDISVIVVVWIGLSFVDLLLRGLTGRGIDARAHATIALASGMSEAVAGSLLALLVAAELLSFVRSVVD